MSTHLRRAHLPPPRSPIHTHTHSFPLRLPEHKRLISRSQPSTDAMNIQQLPSPFQHTDTHTKAGKNTQTHIYIHIDRVFVLHTVFQNGHCLRFAEFSSFVSFPSFATVWTLHIWEILIRSQRRTTNADISPLCGHQINIFHFRVCIRLTCFQGRKAWQEDRQTERVRERKV